MRFLWGVLATSQAESTPLERARQHRDQRLTNGFSKKLFNLEATVAVFMTWYNLCRVHQTLRVTPAMEAGLTDHIWTLRELIIAA